MHFLHPPLVVNVVPSVLLVCQCELTFRAGAWVLELEMDTRVLPGNSITGKGNRFYYLGTILCTKRIPGYQRVIAEQVHR